MHMRSGRHRTCGLWMVLLVSNVPVVITQSLAARAAAEQQYATVSWGAAGSHKQRAVTSRHSSGTDCTHSAAMLLTCWRCAPPTADALCAAECPKGVTGPNCNECSEDTVLMEDGKCKSSSTVLLRVQYTLYRTGLIVHSPPPLTCDVCGAEAAAASHCVQDGRARAPLVCHWQAVRCTCLASAAAAAAASVQLKACVQ